MLLCTVFLAGNEVLELSDLYPNKGTDKYYRAYAEVKKRNIKEK